MSCCSIDNKPIKIVEILEDESLFIEKLWYETEGLKTLIAQFTSDSPFKPDEQRYSLLIKEYIEKYCEYNIIWNILISKYAEEYSKKEYSILVNFNKCQLEISSEKECCCK